METKLKVGNVIENKETGERGTLYDIKDTVALIAIKKDNVITMKVLNSLDGFDTVLCDEGEFGFCDYCVHGTDDNYTKIDSCTYCRMMKAFYELKRGDEVVGTMDGLL